MDKWLKVITITIGCGLVVTILGLLIEYKYFARPSKDGPFNKRQNESTDSRIEKESITPYDVKEPEPISTTKETQTNKTIKLSKAPDVIQALAKISNTDVLMKKLTELVRSDLITRGNKSDFVPPDGCYVIVADNEKVWEIFLFQNNTFYEIGSDRQIHDLASEFSGKRQIWIKYYEE